MRHFILSVSFLSLSLISFSQDSTYIKIPADTSAFYVIEMNDGTVLKGKIIAHKGSEIDFRDNNLGVVSMNARKISSIEKLSADSYFIFYMKEGSFLHGRILRQNENEVEIETKNIGKKTIPLEQIKEMRQIEERDIHRKGKYWYPNPNASRYFFGPSAIPPKKSDGYYQTVDFVVNHVNYGITKNISIGGGAIIPFAVFLMPKYGYKVKKNLHLGGGLIYANTLVKFRKTNYKVGAVYGLVTLGTNNNNITFGAGHGFSDVNKTTVFFKKPVLTINGMARISRRFAIVTENVIIPIKNIYYKAEGKMIEYNYKNSYIIGGRIMKEKITVDFGFLGIPQEIFSAFIYLDFVIKF